MVGVGSMGGMMSLLFAEEGIAINFFDPSDSNAETLLENARNANLADKIKRQKGYESLCKSLDSPRVFIFSLPHGNIADKTIEGLLPHLRKGDILVDASNEHWQDTKRRQDELEPQGIHFIGMGVSGGNQSPRPGPSMSLGGKDTATGKIMPPLSNSPG